MRATKGIRIYWAGIYYRVERNGHSCGLTWRRKNREWIAVQADRSGVVAYSLLQAARHLLRSRRT